MKIFKKVLLWLAAIPLALIAAVVVVQTYYALTPVPLSKEAEELNARAAKLPTVTENGYRLNGLLAPKDLDPVVYGRCLVETYKFSRFGSRTGDVPSMDDKVAFKAYWEARNAKGVEMQNACLKGGSSLKLPELPNEVRIRLGMPDEHWQRIASAPPDQVIVTRAESVWSSGPRRIGAEPEAMVGNTDALFRVQRYRTASAMQFWRSGDRSRAIEIWNRSVSDWAAAANGTLIDAVISSAAIGQVVFAIQTAVAQSERLDDETARALSAVLEPAASLPQSLSDAMLAEWQTRLLTAKQILNWSESAAEFGIRHGTAGHIFERLSRFTYDENDTLNRLATSNVWVQSAVVRAANGGDVGPYPLTEDSFGCPALGELAPLCLVFQRNPIGRVIGGISAPMYPPYGTRVADLRNLASATRLTIEARRRGLSGDALAAFVANAPADMRDVFTGKPFEYDAAKKELRPVLREKNTVLGEKGPYALPL
jgi:hypothetical protein